MRRHGNAPDEGLTAAECDALHRLDRADGVLARWPAGQVLTRTLSRKGLVRVYPEFVLLTDAGRQALAADQEQQDRRPTEPER
jgi:hypothetical protein